MQSISKSYTYKTWLKRPFEESVIFKAAHNLGLDKTPGWMCIPKEFMEERRSKKKKKKGSRDIFKKIS